MSKIEASGQPGVTTVAENRNGERRRVGRMTYVEIGTENGGLLLDLSKGGLSLQAARVLPVGKLMTLRFRLPRAKEPMEVKAEVAWLSTSQKQAGLRFVDLPEGTRAAIAGWLASHQPEELQEQPAVDGQETREVGRDVGPWPARVGAVEDAELGKGSVVRNEAPQNNQPHNFPPSALPDELNRTIKELKRKLESTTVQADAAKGGGVANGAAEPVLPAFRLNETSLFGADVPVGEWVQAAPSKPRLVRWALYGVLAASFFAFGLAIGTGKQDVLLDLLGWREPQLPPPLRLPSADSVPGLQAAASVPGSNADAVPEPADAAPTPEPPARPTPSASERNSQGGENRTRDVQRSARRFSNRPDSNWRIATEKGHLEHPDQRAVLVRAPSRGGMPLLLTLPDRTVAASPGMAITSRRAVEIAPLEDEFSPSVAQRVVVGRLLFHRAPDAPLAGIPEGSSSVEILARVGLGGEVVEARLVGGSSVLGVAALRAIREWLYEPTLVAGRRVESQDDIRIIFRNP